MELLWETVFLPDTMERFIHIQDACTPKSTLTTSTLTNEISPSLTALRNSPKEDVLRGLKGVDVSRVFALSIHSSTHLC